MGSLAPEDTAQGSGSYSLSQKLILPLSLSLVKSPNFPASLFPYDAEDRARFLSRTCGTRQVAGGEGEGGSRPAWTGSAEVCECAPAEVI